MRLDKEIPWEDDKLRADLDWTRTVLVLVHTLGQHIEPNYDPSAIETFSLGSRLVLAQFRYPGRNMGVQKYPKGNILSTLQKEIETTEGIDM